MREVAAVKDPVQLERILRYVGLCPEPGDVEAIRGPPEELWPAEDLPRADLDALDELPAVDDVA